jgi:hypothetical protein
VEYCKKLLSFLKQVKIRLIMSFIVAHGYNLDYLGGLVKEDYSSWLAWQKVSETPSQPASLALIPSM